VAGKACFRRLGLNLRLLKNKNKNKNQKSRRSKTSHAPEQFDSESKTPEPKVQLSSKKRRFCRTGALLFHGRSHGRRLTSLGGEPPTFGDPSKKDRQMAHLMNLIHGDAWGFVDLITNLRLDIFSEDGLCNLLKEAFELVSCFKHWHAPKLMGMCWMWIRKAQRRLSLLRGVSITKLRRQVKVLTPPHKH